MIEDFERCYRAVSSRDARFDGWFVTAVTSTRIYCRPSCPALTPKRANVRFYATAAGAQSAGFRACKRCRPDASPGSPEWNVRADLVARAMRLIGDGVVDREGVAGLARRLHYSKRHLHRQIVAELGAGPQAIARAHRAQTARILVETTSLPFSEVAFAAGFASIRQFNDTIRAIFASSPSELRKRRRVETTGVPGSVSVRLAYRQPFFAPGLFGFLGDRAVPGIEEFDGTTLRRSLALPHGTGTAELTDMQGYVRCLLRLHDVRDLAPAVHRCRNLLDLDADPVAVDEFLGTDDLLRPFVRRAPGRRVPRTVDGTELATRAVLGQQVSVAGVRTLAGRLVAMYGKPLDVADGGLTHVFPTAEVLADADLSKIGMPASRRATLTRLASAIATKVISVHPAADRQETSERLLELPGIGPWTVSYIQMRALGDPDAFLPTDLGVVKALRGKGDPVARAEQWRPWRAYALQHLWASLGTDQKEER